METKRTSGDWAIEPENGWNAARNCEVIVIGTDDEFICEVLSNHEIEPDDIANARLIAASPTMFSYIQRKAAEGDVEAAQIMEAVYANS